MRQFKNERRPLNSQAFMGRKQFQKAYLPMQLISYGSGSMTQRTEPRTMESNSQGIGNWYPARFQNCFGPVPPGGLPFSPSLNRSICGDYPISVLLIYVKGWGWGRE